MLDLSNRLFPYPHDFYDAFRGLSGGRIEYSQTGPRGPLSYSSRAHYEYLHSSSLVRAFPIIRCDEAPVCRRGGFELQQEISMMVAAKKTEDEFEIKCAGFTGRLGADTAEPCRNRLRCRISLEYKPDDEHLDAR
jgi:hypothetical protein